VALFLADFDFFLAFLLILLAFAFAAAFCFFVSLVFLDFLASFAFSFLVSFVFFADFFLPKRELFFLDPVCWCLRPVARSVCQPWASVPPGCPKTGVVLIL